MDLWLGKDLCSQRTNAYWEKVDASGDCWEWTGASMSNGYGTYSERRDDTKRKTWMAHRVAYQSLRRERLGSLVIDHLCRNRLCVNPDHMEAVTRGENVLRGYGTSAKNARKTHCVRGHPYDDANTHIAPSGQRQCRACWPENSRKQYLRSKGLL